MPETKRQILRRKMEEGTVYAPFVLDGMQAIIAQKYGCPAVYMTGFGVASTYGLPDVGLITLTEIAEHLKIINGSVDLPVIADADTGYGSYSNVMRTVKEYEFAGVAAMHLEDQLWPKRCGYMADKQVIDKREATNKIKAAVDARIDQDLIIIARTDALAVNGWSDVEDRLGSYMEAGADMAFVDGIRTLEDVKQYWSRLSKYKLLFNNVPNLPMNEVRKVGNFPIVLNPGPMTCAWQEYETEVREFIRTGNAAIHDADGIFNHIVGILGAQKYFDLDKKYKTGD